MRRKPTILSMGGTLVEFAVEQQMAGKNEIPFISSQLSILLTEMNHLQKTYGPFEMYDRALTEDDMSLLTKLSDMGDHTVQVPITTFLRMMYAFNYGTAQEKEANKTIEGGQ